MNLLSVRMCSGIRITMTSKEFRSLSESEWCSYEIVDVDNITIDSEL